MLSTPGSVALEVNCEAPSDSSQGTGMSQQAWAFDNKELQELDETLPTNMEGICIFFGKVFMRIPKGSVAPNR